MDACTARHIEGVETAFPVEFARSSRARSGGPTLVPVETGGAAVDAKVLVLKDTVDEEHARGMLYRRETRRVGEPVPDPGAGWIHKTSSFSGIDTCLYTALKQNIDPLTVQRLAELAITSACGSAGAESLDGISYLREQKRHGVMTPLMPGYEAEILSETGAPDLADAWKRARAHARNSD